MTKQIRRLRQGRIWTSEYAAVRLSENEDTFLSMEGPPLGGSIPAEVSQRACLSAVNGNFKVFRDLCLRATEAQGSPLVGEATVTLNVNGTDSQFTARVVAGQRDGRGVVPVEVRPEDLICWHIREIGGIGAPPVNARWSWREEF